MLRWLYNSVLLIGVILALPVLLVKAVKVPGYAAWIGRRLGWPQAGPSPVPNRRPTGGKDPAAPCIWLHALSVGETASALPLLRALRKRYPRATLVLSSSTRAGAARAAENSAGLVNRHLVMPYDLPWLSSRVVREVRPDLFILVETDFWPNLLWSLRLARVPMLLVNGRISAASWRYYRWLRPLVRPLCFAPFALLAMQTGAEAERLLGWGVEPARVGVMGNLKYPAAVEGARRVRKITRAELGLEQSRILWVAGSTHAGEEEILFKVFRRLLADFPALFLVLGPRRVERAAAVAALAEQEGCRVRRRRQPSASPATPQPADVLVLDRYGELPALYALAEVVFIGGSLVPAGGHNPLEAAVWQKNIFFGPHMEDFAEISRDLLAVGGGTQVVDEDDLLAKMRRCLADPAPGAAAGQRAAALLTDRSRGVLAAHLQAVRSLL